jgi:hypothetical protein
MPDQQDEKGAQQEGANERHAEGNQANQQDLEKPAEGRDVPPEADKPKRSPDSPWMGGG